MELVLRTPVLSNPDDLIFEDINMGNKENVKAIMAKLYNKLSTVPSKA